MIKESAICAALISAGVVLLALGLGRDLSEIWPVVLFFAALPFLGAAWLQFRVLGAISHGKANSWLGSEILRPRPRSQVVIEQPTRATIELPKPEQIRLLPVHTFSSSTNLIPADLRSNGETIRTVPVHVPRLIDQADERDLIAFIEGLQFRGHSSRSWIGVRMPSGRPVDSDYYDLLIAPLVKCGAIINRRRRAAGRLIMDASEIKQCLGLSAPTALTACTALPALQ